jgi:hypothetical protein
MINSYTEIHDTLRKVRIISKFDESNKHEILSIHHDHLLNDEIFENCSIQNSNVIVFFLTKKFINSDKFKEDWSQIKNKVVLIILLENIETCMNLDLKDYFVSDCSSLMNNLEEIKRMKMFLLRLSNLTATNHNIILEENIFIELINDICIEDLEFIEDNQVIVKKRSMIGTVVIIIIDRTNGNTIGTINNQDLKQNFCWIGHLNQIFCHQNNLIEESYCSLFSTSGNLIRSVFVIYNNIHQVNSVSYNKNNCEVYLNVFDKSLSKNSILILDKDFLLIKTIDNELTNSDFSLNYASEIQIFNAEYKVFDYNSNISLLQEKMYEVQTHSYIRYYEVRRYGNISIFDKLSYSIVGVIKTSDKLIKVIGDKLFFLKNVYHYEIRKMLKIHKPNIDNCNAFCKLSSPFKQPHLLSNQFRILPCGNAACLDCIYNNYNLFKLKFICVICNQEHKLPKEFLVHDGQFLSELLNEDLLRELNTKTNKVISDIGIGKLFKSSISIFYNFIITVFYRGSMELF